MLDLELTGFSGAPEVWFADYNHSTLSPEDINQVLPQRVHIHCHYGIRYRKTIPIMVLGA